MSKQEKQDEKKTQKSICDTEKREQRIPDAEWLFGYGEKPKRKGTFLGKLMRRDWKVIVYTTLIYLLQSLPVYVMPLITSDVIDLITLRPDGYQTRLLVEGIALMLIIIQNVPSTMWRSRVLNKWVRGVTAEIKSCVVRKLQRLSITYHKEMEEGRIQSKFLRDIETVEGYYRNTMTGLIPTVVSAIISAIIAIIKSPIVALFFVCIIPLNVMISMSNRKRIRQDWRAYRKENEKLSTKLTTTIQMMSLTKAHGLISTEEMQVNEKINSVTDAGLRLDKTVARFGAANWMITQLFSAICLFFCVFLVFRDVITVGEVVLFQSLFSSLSASVMSLINYYPMLTSGQEAVDSLSEIIGADELEQNIGKDGVAEIKGEVRLENVSYSYPGEEKKVVKAFNLHVKQGERIAVVGSSGSGKSTLMNLLIGLLSPTEGRIYIDGKAMEEMSMNEYRQFLSVVPQNSILFSGSLRDNITYGLDVYSEEELLTAIENANLSEFLASLPNGLETIIGEHGDKLSGGQKQRVSIARALIRNPKILILDEATSALDNVSEFQVQQAIDRLINNRTTFIVAHRLSTIRNADRIVVMEEGALVEIGTYEELMALGGKFSELEKLSRIREERDREAC